MVYSNHPAYWMYIDMNTVLNSVIKKGQTFDLRLQNCDKDQKRQGSL